MNAYERRRRERLMAAGARQKRNTEFKHARTLSAAHKLMQRYEDAYSKYYKRICKLSYSNGWYTVHHRKVRAARLEEMAVRLEALVHEQTLLHPEES